MSQNINTQPGDLPASDARTAVVGLVVRNDEILTIQRSATVRAPLKWCFPGGIVEPGESLESALVRELQEELSLAATPVREVWRSVTPWETRLHWWLAKIPNGAQIKPDPNEVADFAWNQLFEFRNHPNLLESNTQFLDLVLAGEISLAGGPGNCG